jgi:hypothetical protein
MVLKKRAVGLAAGIMWGLSVMLGTWWLMWSGQPGTTISKLSAFYFGYSFTFLGGIIGLLWGFVDGFICGVVFAWLYNAFAGGKKKAEGDEG